MFLNIIELAQSLGVDEGEVEGWIRNDGLPHVTDRGRLLFDRTQVVGWAESHGLAARVGFLTPERAKIQGGNKLETMLRSGGIWRDIPAANISSMTSCGLALLRTMAPMLIILAHGKVKIWASKLLYRPLYKILPRPTGESVFRGLHILPPSLEYDAPDNPQPPGAVGFRSEDEPTLRALEGLPTINRTESRPQQSEQNEDSSSEEEDDEIAHATLISFDVEATESAENPLGAWSAELRSANEPKPSGDTKYRVTGLTMLPVFTLTEGLRDIAATIIVMPLEAVMIRLIGRAYRLGAGLPTADLYPVGPRLRGFGNLLGVLTMQVAATGIVWAGFTLVTQTWASNVRRKRAERAENEASSRS